MLSTLLFVGLATGLAVNESKVSRLSSREITPLVQNASSASHEWFGIIQWTVLGDSYATGSVLAIFWLGIDAMPGIRPDRQMWNCACSGATTQDILDHQFLDVPKVDPEYGVRSVFGVPRIATSTAGGDDVDFLHLVLRCILQFYWTDGLCRDTIDSSRKTLENDKWRNSLDAVIKTTLAEGREAAGDGFKLFVTGYTEFFNNRTTQCSKATFSYWDRHHYWGIGENENPNFPMNLTQDLRTQLNLLTSDMNTKIQDIVLRNEGVEYVDYNARFEGHRFCEEGVTEPDPDNPNTWFFQSHTAGNGRTADLDGMLAARLDPSGNASQFQATIQAGPPQDDPLSQDPTRIIDLLMSIGDVQDDSIKSGILGWFRIFLPRRPGLDAMVDQIVDRFPTWPEPDPWVAAATSSGPAAATSTQPSAPDQRSGPPPTIDFCQTFKDCPGCPQGQCPNYSAA